MAYERSTIDEDTAAGPFGDFAKKKPDTTLRLPIPQTFSAARMPFNLPLPFARNARLLLTAGRTIETSKNYICLFKKQKACTHFGICVVRHDNDPARDLTPKGIVAAIRKLEAAGVPIANEYIVLNHWR